MESYLVQRANFRKSESKGIDGLLKFDYMGSAEFEFGALPKSLKRIRANSGDYMYESFDLGKNLSLFFARKKNMEIPKLKY